MTITCWIHGYSGRMGSEIRQLIGSSPDTWKLVGGSAKEMLADAQSLEQWNDWHRLPQYLKRSDLIIDFSTSDANFKLLSLFKSSPDISEKSLLLGTTGLSDESILAWEQVARSNRLRLLFAPNTSLGVLLTLKVSQLLGQVLSPLQFDIELVESHHRNKLDAPSGTAKFLAEGIAKKLDKNLVYGRTGKRLASEIGLASLRGGSVFGEHEIRYLGDHEEITVSHRALTRTLFAQGALHLAQWLVKKDFGIYQLEDISIEDMVQLLNSSKGVH